MDNESRTFNVFRNAGIGIICQVVNLLLAFIARRIFINTLSSDYLGVSGLFANILTILSFAELGIGNAIIYNLYLPLANRDISRIKSLMALYAKAYRSIGIIIAIIGLCVTPYLYFFIKDKPDIEYRLEVIYLLYLSNTVASYFFVYKKSIIIADQKNYIVTIYQQIFVLFQIIIQSIFLMMTHEFIIYLLVQIFFTLLNNIYVARKANRLYPFLKEKNISNLSKVEKNKILKDVQALAVYKFGSTMMNGTDNILISMLIGVAVVGQVSNYLLVISGIMMVLGKVMESFTASVGNLNAIEAEKVKADVFNKLYLICVWLYGFLSVGLLLLFNSFVELWIGKEYLLPIEVVFAIVLSFYVDGVRFPSYTYRTTLGVFRTARYAPVIASILNIVLSIGLFHVIGLSGVFFATAISRFFVISLLDNVLVFRMLKMSVGKYYIKYFLYISIFAFLCLLLNFLFNLFPTYSWLVFLIKVLIVTAVFNITMAIICYRTKEFKEILTSVKVIFCNSIKQ